MIVGFPVLILVVVVVFLIIRAMAKKDD